LDVEPVYFSKVTLFSSFEATTEKGRQYFERKKCIIAASVPIPQCKILAMRLT